MIKNYTDYILKIRFLKVLPFSLSLFLVAFAQPAWFSVLGVFSSAFGLTLFFKHLESFEKRSSIFLQSFIWFSMVQLIQLSWMSASEYQGSYIYIVYLFVCSALGAQFGLFCMLLPLKNKLTKTHLFFFAALWALFEYSRLYFLCGFPFNPIGLSLSCSILSRQFASFGGIYFLSFWVMLCNLALYRAIKKSSMKSLYWALGLIAVPYLYGFFQLQKHDQKLLKHPEKVNALLVQTALTPEEKTGMSGFDKMMPPLLQWKALFEYLKPYGQKDVDVIVFPERTVPFSDTTKLYPTPLVKKIITQIWGEKALNDLPLTDEELLDNVTLCQFVADFFNAQVLVGLEHLHDLSEEDYLAYASAFSFRPHKPFQRYHKRVLLPLVEYMPFEWCKKVAKRYHIEGWYERGDESIVFEGPLKVSPSICIEELYGHLFKQQKNLGAKLFVNMTNDVWFPNSNLPKQHYTHGLIRAVENGTPLLRACNTGVTAAIDALGRSKAILGSLKKEDQWTKGALLVQLSTYSFKTPYSLWGESFLFFCFALPGFLLILNRFKRLKALKSVN